MKRVFMIGIIFLWVLVGVSFAQNDASTYTDVEKQNTPLPNATPPEKVYLNFVDAVYKGDLRTVKKLVCSAEVPLWDRAGRKMLAIEKNQVPENPTFVGKEPFKKYQYNYMILKLTGVTKKGIHKKGVVFMVVENGHWKVEARMWSPRLSFSQLINLIANRK